MAQMSKAAKEQMSMKLLNALIEKSGGEGSPDWNLPDYCGECRFYHKEGGHSVARCHRNPPEVPEPLYSSDVEKLADFEYLRPPVMPEDVACGDGIRR